MAENRLSLILEARVRGFVQGMRRASNATIGLQAASRNAKARVEGSFIDLDRKLETISSRIVKRTISIRNAILLLVAGGLVKKATDFAGEFETALGAVDTLLDKSSVSIDKYRESLIRLSKTSGKDIIDSTKALYQIVSAGISTTQGAEKANSVLAASSRLAVGGLSTQTEAAEALIRVLNAYESSGISAADASDKLFQVVKKGIITLPQLSAVIGNVAGKAGTYGIALDDLLASTAALTRIIGPEESITSLGRIIDNLVNPPTERAAALFEQLGVNASAAGLRANGLVGTLKKIQTEVKGDNDVLKVLFGNIRSSRGTAILLGEQFDKLVQFAEKDFPQSAGTLDGAFNKLSNTWQIQAQNLKNRWSNVLIEVGDKVIPKVAKVLDGLVTYTEQNSDKIAGFFDIFLDTARGVGQFFVEIAPTLEVAVGLLVEFARVLGSIVASVGPTLAKFAIGFAAAWGFKALILGTLSLTKALGTLGQAAQKTATTVKTSFADILRPGGGKGAPSPFADLSAGFGPAAVGPFFAKGNQISALKRSTEGFGRVAARGFLGGLTTFLKNAAGSLLPLLTGLFGGPSGLIVAGVALGATFGAALVGAAEKHLIEPVRDLVARVNAEIVRSQADAVAQLAGFANFAESIQSGLRAIQGKGLTEAGGGGDTAEQLAKKGESADQIRIAAAARIAELEEQISNARERTAEVSEEIRQIDAQIVASQADLAKAEDPFGEGSVVFIKDRIKGLKEERERLEEVAQANENVGAEAARTANSIKAQAEETERLLRLQEGLADGSVKLIRSDKERLEAVKAGIETITQAEIDQIKLTEPLAAEQIEKAVKRQEEAAKLRLETSQRATDAEIDSRKAAVEIELATVGENVKKEKDLRIELINIDLEAQLAAIETAKNAKIKAIEEAGFSSIQTEEAIASFVLQREAALLAAEAARLQIEKDVRKGRKKAAADIIGALREAIKDIVVARLTAIADGAKRRIEALTNAGLGVTKARERAEIEAIRAETEAKRFALEIDLKARLAAIKKEGFAKKDAENLIDLLRRENADELRRLGEEELRRIVSAVNALRAARAEFNAQQFEPEDLTAEERALSGQEADLARERAKAEESSLGFLGRQRQETLRDLHERETDLIYQRASLSRRILEGERTQRLRNLEAKEAREIANVNTVGRAGVEVEEEIGRIRSDYAFEAERINEDADRDRLLAAGDIGRLLEEGADDFAAGMKRAFEEAISIARDFVGVFSSIPDTMEAAANALKGAEKAETDAQKARIRLTKAQQADETSRERVQAARARLEAAKSRKQEIDDKVALGKATEQAAITAQKRVDAAREQFEAAQSRRQEVRQGIRAAKIDVKTTKEAIAQAQEDAKKAQPTIGALAPFAEKIPEVGPLIALGIELVDNLNAVIANLGQFLASIFEGLVSTLVEMPKAFTTFFSEGIPILIQSVISNIPEIIKALIDLLPEVVFSFIRDGVPAIATALVEGVKDAFTDIFSGFADPKAAASRLGGAVKGAAVGAAIGTVIPGVGTLLGAGIGGGLGLLFGHEGGNVGQMGRVRHFQGGGHAIGKRLGDTIPAMLRRGEGVLTPEMGVPAIGGPQAVDMANRGVSPLGVGGLEANVTFQSNDVAMQALLQAIIGQVGVSLTTPFGTVKRAARRNRTGPPPMMQVVQRGVL